MARADLDDFLSTAEACEWLRCSPPTLRRYARENNWQRVRITQRNVLYRRSEIERHIKNNTYTVRS